MIVALDSIDERAGAAALAQALAALRAKSGNKVLLATHSDVMRGAALYDDVVVDTCGASAADSAAVLAAAGVIVVLIRPSELETARHAALLARICIARAANPRAQVLVMVSDTQQALSPHDAGCVLVFVARIASARLADTLVLDDSGAVYRPGHREPDAQIDKLALSAPEVRHLYGQVFYGATALA